MNQDEPRGILKRESKSVHFSNEDHTNQSNYEETTRKSEINRPSKITIIFRQWIAGVIDALNLTKIQKVISRSESVPLRLLDILIYNGIVNFGSLMLFQLFVRPIIRSLFEELEQQEPSNLIEFFGYISESSLVGTFYLIWVIPVFLISFVINARWLATISERAILILAGGSSSNTSALKSLSQLPKGLASEVYTTTFYIMFVLQSILCTWIPFLGSIINIVVLSWLYSLYCFEYKWSSWNIGRRLKYVEDNWPYFSGFGLVVGCPFTLATVYLGFWVGYAIWFLLFPLFIITAIGSKEPPYSQHKEGNISMALFVFAKWLNMFFLKLLVILIKFFTGGRPQS